jgi:arsenite methyltransferase
MLLWVGCIAGALEEQDYRAKLLAAGFTGVDFEATRTYDIEDARHFLEDAGVDVESIAPLATGSLMSAFVRATKPARPCCGPACCN